jgi:hypothetical protein
MNHVSLRFGTHHRYNQAIPLCGRTGRLHDYPAWTRLCFLLGNEVSSFLRCNPCWRRSSQVYSHSVITWSKRTLRITVFFLNYSRRRRRTYRNLRRRRRLLGYLSRNLLISLFSLVRGPSFAARRLVRQCRVLRRSRFSARRRVVKRANHKRRDLPRRRRRRGTQQRNHQKIKYRKYSGYRRLRYPARATKLLTWVKILRSRRFGVIRDKKQFSSLPVVKGLRFSRRRWLILAWRMARRRYLRRASAAELWISQKTKAYGVPLCWRWKRLPRVCSVNTVLAMGAYRLRGRFTRRINLMARPLLRLAQRVPGMQSVHLRCAGRFTRQERADCKTYRVGKSLGRSNFSQPLQSGRWVVPLKFGTVSLTMTMSLSKYASPRRSR